MTSPTVWLACAAFVIMETAPSPAAPSIQVTGLTGQIPPAALLPAVFGDRKEDVDLQLNGATTPSASLRADFFQVSGSLSLPLSRDVHLQEKLTLPSATSPQNLRVPIQFPAVARRTELLLRLTLVQDAPLSPIPLGEIRFDLFPTGITKELTDLLQPTPNGHEPVLLFGSGTKLRHFLTGLHVHFEDLGGDTPDRFDPKRLYFGELDTEEKFHQAQDRSAGGRVIVFSPDDSLPVGAYTNPSGSGLFIQVTAPLLDNLDTDPRAQLALIKFIHLLSNPPPSAN